MLRIYVKTNNNSELSWANCENRGDNILNYGRSSWTNSENLKT